MKITDLIIDPKSLGNKLWLVDVTPAYEYKDNRRTDTVTGYRYAIAMPEKGAGKNQRKNRRQAAYGGPGRLCGGAFRGPGGIHLLEPGTAPGGGQGHGNPVGEQQDLNP